jgi:hypothetical protein
MNPEAESANNEGSNDKQAETAIKTSNEPEAESPTTKGAML